ncbi:hypothetical protein BMJ22_34105 [Sinorhizobium medicae]|nr:hypothetical protein BMJ22_34105 [Sinorhizobium medicae]
MNILSVASEVYPLVKTGGLADVVGALPVRSLPAGKDGGPGRRRRRTAHSTSPAWRTDAHAGTRLPLGAAETEEEKKSRPLRQSLRPACDSAFRRSQRNGPARPGLSRSLRPRRRTLSGYDRARSCR